MQRITDNKSDYDLRLTWFWDNDLFLTSKVDVVDIYNLTIMACLKVKHTIV